MVVEKNDKRHVTRNRASYSCWTCRRRKVKCDKVHPVCGGCRKANERCVYGSDHAQLPSGLPKGRAEASGVESKKRKTSISVRGETTESMSAPSIQGDSVLPQLKAIEDQLHHLTALMSTVRQSTGGNAHDTEPLTPVLSHSDHGYENVSRGAVWDREMSPPKEPSSSNDAGELARPLSSLQIGPGGTQPSSDNPGSHDSFWTYISDEIEQLNQLMRHRHSAYMPSAGAQKNLCGGGKVHQPQTNTGTTPADDFWEPLSFQKEASPEMSPDSDLDTDCSICKWKRFDKSSLLQDTPFSPPPAAVTRHILAGLPTKVQSHVLFRCWLTGVHSVIPIVSPDDVLKDYETFWSHQDSITGDEDRIPNPDFLPLLFTIWYAGSRSISAKGLRRWFWNTTRAKLCAEFYDHAVFCLQVTCFKRQTTLQTLTAYVLLQSLPSAEEDPFQASLYVHLAVRLAQTIGLHRDPAIFNVSAVEAEMRRRLWSQIIQLDASLVASSGYPPLISEEFCDTSVMGDTKEEHIEDGPPPPPQSAAPIRGQPPVTVSDMVARATFIMTCALRRVMAAHLRTKLLTKEDMKEMNGVIGTAETEVNSIISKIPAKGLPESAFTPDTPKDVQTLVLDCEPQLGNPPTKAELAFYARSPMEGGISSFISRQYRVKEEAYHKWARISLSLMTDKMRCVAYTPFLKNVRSKFWNVGRQCALRHCHSFMRKFISLAADPALAPFRWSWPGMYPPMHAAVIILVDLYERPDSVEAPRSRALLDKVFELSGPDSGIVGGPDGVTTQRPLREGGIEVWDMLRGLRSKAWRKAGLDPSVLWSEQDQVEVGAAAPLTEAQKIAQSLREDTVYTGTSSTNGSNQQSKLTVSVLRQAFKSGVSEAVRMSDTNAHACVRTMRHQMLQGMEPNFHSVPFHHLARREGQQAMPFPLIGHAANLAGGEATACPSAINSHIGIAGALHIDVHGWRPPTDNLSCGHEENLATKPDIAGAAVEDAFRRDDPTQNVNGGESIPPLDPPDHRQSYTTSQATENHFSITPLATTAGLENDVHMSAFNLSGGQAPQDDHADGGGDEQHYSHNDLGFDWDRWDAVFGQYSGFTDLMVWDMEDAGLSEAH